MSVELKFVGKDLSSLLWQMHDFLDAAVSSESAGPVEAPEADPGAEAPPRPSVAETAAIEVPVEDTPADAVAAEKLKNDVIRSLESLYKAGKVNVIRSALTKYGDGAKSFLEIEASKFREIREALAKGEIA